jgi:formyltetrahydrofolate synthetase
MAILNTVKKALLIPLVETYADEELQSHIEACKELLRSVGVADDVVNGEGVPIVDSLILIYCKTFFGFKNDGSVKELPKSFEMLVRQLSFTKGSTP